ncbi:MAG: biopolymer transporter ExbD [Cocleimonas sp.]|nr:biopolymer transporter ExbD [Cocleimonas sp.]
MNFRQHVIDDVEVSLTPLIDVVFLLLIFFMITTTFDRDAKIKIDLPTTANAPVLVQNNTLELLIDSQGRYYVDGLEVLNNKPETLFQAMSQALDKYKNNPALVISGDSKANYQAVITAIDIAGRLGLTNLSMATTQSKRQK